MKPWTLREKKRPSRHFFSSIDNGFCQWSTFVTNFSVAKVLSCSYVPSTAMLFAGEKPWQPSADWKSGYSMSFLANSLSPLLFQASFHCYVKSFPIFGPYGTNEREETQEKDLAGQPPACNSNHQHHVFGNKLHIHRHRKMEWTNERRKESQLSSSGQENQERTSRTLRIFITRRI